MLAPFDPRPTSALRHPRRWPDEASYEAHLDRLRAVGSLRAGEGLWEDLRLHHVYGTLEVRICDATPSIDRIWLIVALLQAEVATLEDEVRRGCAPEPVARALLEDNKFRVCRHGMDAELVDWHTGAVTPLSTRLQPGSIASRRRPRASARWRGSRRRFVRRSRRARRRPASAAGPSTTSSTAWSTPPRARCPPA